MKIDATTIDDLIEKSGTGAGALSKLDALIIAAAPQLPRRLFRGPSITMIGYGERCKKFEDLDQTAVRTLVHDAVATAAVQSRTYGRDCARPVER